MKTIIPPDPLVRRILGDQKARGDVSYRYLCYVVKCEVPDGILLYNNMTKELLHLTCFEAESIDNFKNMLIGKWFLVPEDQNDRLLLQNLRELISCVRPKSKDIVSYTIFTTTDCNARCFYCFQGGRPRRHMSRDTASRLTDYISEHSGSNTVTLNWFGGEPLYNVQVIDDICSGLSEKGIKYRSKMISNGYLFDESVVERAVNLWKLLKVQITLDGTEEVYNRSKSFANTVSDESPYRRVIRNIGLLLNAGILVDVRLNLGKQNGDDLCKLVDELEGLFGGRSGFIIYASPILEQAEGAVGETGWDYSDDIYKELNALRNNIENREIGYIKRLKRNLSFNSCMADNDNAVTILPGGEIGLCDHFTESEYIGHIDSDEFDIDVKNSWKERIEDGPHCPDCPCCPDCIILKKCQCGRPCIFNQRKGCIDRLKKSVVYEYKLFCHKNGADDVDDGCENSIENC